MSISNTEARDAILEAVAYTGVTLHNPQDLDGAVRSVLGGMGRALGVSRAYIFRNRDADGTLVVDLTHEWVDEGVTPQIDIADMQGVPYDAGFERWRAELSRGRPVHGRIESFPADEREFLAAQDIRSLVVMPISVAGDWWGFLGLDDCAVGQVWSDQVLAVLSVAANTLGAALRRRDLEARLEEQRRQLEMAQRLDALGRLAGGIAHDFNNILAAIGAHVALLSDDVRHDDGVVGEFREIQGYVQRGTDLTRQLLAFGGRQPLEPETMDLREAVLSIRPMLDHLMTDGVRLEVEVTPEPLPVRVDPAQLNQVVMNLVVNARDAMAEGGTVRVRAARSDSGGTARLTVSDQGPGMPPEVRDRMFEPFFTTKGERGTGLGLSTVFGIVSQSGGSIHCQSEAGQGTEFSVEFPLT